MSVPMIDNAKIMSKGQVTIPREIRKLLKVSEGDRVTFICEGDYAIVMNANIYALKTLQKAMEGEAEKAGLTTEDDIIALCREVRAEQNRSIVDSLAMPGAADIDFEPPRITIGTRPADFS